MKRQALIEQFRQGAAAVSAALEDIRDEELDLTEGPGEWSVRAVVHHLADAELMRGARLFQLLADDEPVVYKWDEGAFARRLHYDRDVESSLATFCALRSSLASLVERLSDQEWDREGVHTEFESFTVGSLIERGVSHVDTHLDQIQRARSRLASAE